MKDYSLRYKDDFNPPNQLESLKSDARHLHKIRMDFLVKKLKDIKSEMGKKTRILDLGCGDGVVTSYIISVFNGDEVIGIDLNRSRLKRAAKNCKKAKFLLGDATALKFSDNSFDMIIIHHIIEHIPNDKKVLKECYRVLKDGGYLIVGIPNEGGFVGKLLRNVSRGVYRKSEHLNFYSIKTMSDKLYQNGFRCIEKRGFGFLFPIYYVHYIILRNYVSFRIGNWLTQKLKFTADSLFFIARKRRLEC